MEQRVNSIQGTNGKSLTWFYGVCMVLSVLALATTAMGATYNLYFNNTEQGDNSTATPQLTVKSGEGQALTSPVPEVQASPVAVAEAPSPSPSPSAGTEDGAIPVAGGSDQAIIKKAGDLLEKLMGENKHYPWRLNLSGSAAYLKCNRCEVYDNNYDQTTYDTVRFDTVGLTAGLAYAPVKELSLGIAVGGLSDMSDRELGDMFVRTELAVTPIFIDIGRLDDVFDLGLLIGGTTLARSNSNWLSLYAGAHADINIGHHLAITGAIRGNFGFYQGDVGLTFKL